MIPLIFVTVLFITCSARFRIDQPDKVLTVELGSTVTLQCYTDKDVIFWYKQIAGQQPRVMSAFQKLSEHQFFNEFRSNRFSGKILGKTSNLTISGIIQSDEAAYYCGSKAFYFEFGDGTHLIIKGRQDSASKISDHLNKVQTKSDHLNNFMECQQKCCENSTIVNYDLQEKKLEPAVLGLASALGLCAILVIVLVVFIFTRGSGQENLVRGQSNFRDTDDENLTYAALRFKTMKSDGKRTKQQIENI